jgi:23S rRNA (cytosine1962-C5)-methyltransferase
VVSFNDEKIDENFWKRKIENAYRLRLSLGLVSERNNCYRLVHGEGDNLPGLIVDVYGDTAVLQAHSAGIYLARLSLAEAVVAVVPAVQNVYCKSETTAPLNAGMPVEDTFLIGKNSEEHKARENGLCFLTDYIRGQKTGFFIDQRENRVLLEKYAAQKSVLNMFCYTGGFSLYALQGGAALVHSVDSSARAIALAERNVLLNFGENAPHKAFAQDAFHFMNETSLKYDVVILDPPAFAKRLDALPNALKGYRRLNAAGLERVNPGGLLFTFSCSQAVSRQQFRLAVFSAAAESKRTVRILHQLSQAADHPINIFHPEGEYLKGLVLQVE